MQGNIFCVEYDIAGTLTADGVKFVRFPFGATVVGVYAKCDASTSIILDVGSITDADSVVDAGAVTGHALNPVEFLPSAFAGGVPVHLSSADGLKISVDYDGGAGTDGAGVFIQVYLREG